MKAGCEIKKLGDVIQKTETVNPLNFPEYEFKYIDVSSISNTTFQIEETQLLVGKDAPSRARRKVKENDVLFATIRPTLRRIAIVPQFLDEQVCSTAYFVLRPKKGIDHRYIFYWLFSEEFMGQMEVLQKGASYPAVTDAEVKAQLIPLPPLPEQRRIVAILDESFADIAAAKEKAEQNLKNAKEVFSSSQRRIFSIVEEEYKCNELGKIAEFRNGVNFTKNSKGEVVKIIGVKDFKNNFFVPDENIDSVVIDGTIGEIDLLKNNDILTVRSNGNQELIGRCMIACNINEKTTHSGFTIRIRPKADFVNPTYLCTYLKSDTIRKQLVGEGTGVNIKSLNQKSLSSLAVPIPNLLKQHQIVSQIDSISAETSRLEFLYQQKLSNLEELKKSLLQQAFSGAL